MIYSLFSVLPFVMCLMWTVLYVLHWKEHTDAQHMLLPFACVCTILYMCHAHFFLGERNLWMECLWMACSLASYPLYYLYIVRLTEPERTTSRLPQLLLLPAIILPAIHMLVPEWNIRMVQAPMFMFLVLYVCIRGLMRLHRLERDILNNYADTEDKSSVGLQWLLVCAILNSLFSAVFNAIGRDTFHQDLLVIVPSVLFTTMLFIFFYIGDRYSFSARQMREEDMMLSEEDENLQQPMSSEEQAQFVIRLNQLMSEEKIYLEPNLKLRDLALRAGTCRTYMSEYLHQTLNTSFSDYINEQRIRYAQRLLEADPNVSILYLSAKSGFNSEQSFLRNYRKFTGKSPK